MIGAPTKIGTHVNRYGSSTLTTQQHIIDGAGALEHMVDMRMANHVGVRANIPFAEKG
jgi:hypothetical protein